jgi:hypothetical protein
MESTFQLSPEAARALALRLFTKEQFTADPRGCILAALNWLDAAASETASSEFKPTKPARDTRIERLERIVQERGPEAVAQAIGVSINALRSWLHGTQPNPASYQKIERFLGDSQSSPSTTAAVEQPAERIGELFGQQQAEPESATS